METGLNLCIEVGLNLLKRIKYVDGNRVKIVGRDKLRVDLVGGGGVRELLTETGFTDRVQVVDGYGVKFVGGGRFKLVHLNLSWRQG